ncbi:MAG: tetratricopeptide repeat protein [Casimicrobiaceae bacterium]
MAVYDLEEQERLDELKAWWSRWGSSVVTLILVVCAVIIGVQGWRWWTAKQTDEAATLYAAVSQAARESDLPKAKDAAAQLTDKFSGTGYAPRAALVLAKMQFDAKDAAAAKAQLQWVVDRADETELKEIARYRMAVLLLDDKQYDEALRLLDSKHGEPFAAVYADLRGDALASAGRPAEARAAYQTALAKFDVKSPYRNYVQVKMDALPAAAATQSGSAAVPANVPAAGATAPMPPRPAAGPAAGSTSAPAAGAPAQ